MFRKIIILVLVVIILGLAYKLGSFVFENEVVVENIDNTAPVSEPILTTESLPVEEAPKEEPISTTPTPSNIPKTSTSTIPTPAPAPSPAPAPAPTSTGIDSVLSDLEKELNALDFSNLDSGL